MVGIDLCFDKMLKNVLKYIKIKSKSKKKVGDEGNKK